MFLSCILRNYFRNHSLEFLSDKNFELLFKISRSFNYFSENDWDFTYIRLLNPSILAQIHISTIIIIDKMEIPEKLMPLFEEESTTTGNRYAKYFPLSEIKRNLLEIKWFLGILYHNAPDKYLLTNLNSYLLQRYKSDIEFFIFILDMGLESIGYELFGITLKEEIKKLIQAFSFIYDPSLLYRDYLNIFVLDVFIMDMSILISNVKISHHRPDIYSCILKNIQYEINLVIPHIDDIYKNNSNHELFMNKLTDSISEIDWVKNAYRPSDLDINEYEKFYKRLEEILNV